METTTMRSSVVEVLAIVLLGFFISLAFHLASMKEKRREK